jgi:hypothetical protein
MAARTRITIFARSETCKLVALAITRRMSRAETGLATRPTLIVEELILKEYCLLLRFTGEGLQLIVSVHRVQTTNRKSNKQQKLNPMNRFDGFAKYKQPNEFGSYPRNDLFWKKPKTA